MEDLSCLSFVAWPMAAVVFGVAFLLLFQKQIRQLLGRAKSFGKDGVRFDKEGDRTYEDEQLSAKRPDAPTEFYDEFESPLFLEVESDIEKELQDRGVTDPTFTRKFLLKTLARTFIFRQFEAVHSVIYASQLRSLMFLNIQPTLTTEAELKSRFYDTAVVNFPITYKDRAFGEWLGYLQRQALIIGKEERISLSLRGREFLKWRVDNGFPEPPFG